MDGTLAENDQVGKITVWQPIKTWGKEKHRFAKESYKQESGQRLNEPETELPQLSSEHEQWFSTGQAFAHVEDA